MGKSILIAMPAYNEEESIGSTLEKLQKIPLADMCEILVVNDGSRDRTVEICESMGVRVVTHVYNMGYGAALKTAYKYAVRNGFEYVIQLDADGQHDVSNVGAIYDALTNTDGVKPDIVMGSRFLENSVSFYVSGLKKAIIFFFTSVIRLSTKKSITDPTSGLQGLSKDAFTYYTRYNNFVTDFPDANMIIQMILSDHVIVEIPAVMHPRVAGKSMHSGLKPVIYLMKMLVSTAMVIMRGKLNKKQSDPVRLVPEAAAGKAGERPDA